jgi:hypothetical protein
MIASDPPEWESAFRLVASNYQAAGYEPPGSKPLRFTPYHVLPETVTFVAKHCDQVVMTLSLVTDNTLLGLPMESVYPEEIAGLRYGGLHLAEVISFAAADLRLREFNQVFWALIRLMKQYHVRQGGTGWVITVNPRHRQFYTKNLGYIPIGACRPYSRVQGAPAEAFLVDVNLMRSNAPGAYHSLFDQDLPPASLQTPGMPPSLARRFAAQSSQTDSDFADALLQKIARTGSSRRWEASQKATADRDCHKAHTLEALQVLLSV